MMRVHPELQGVPRTALWTLHCRAAFAERGLIEDREAIRIRNALVPRDLRRDFGRPAPSFARFFLDFNPAT
ncbi:MAG: class I SAM-dependent methyltransferase, partial [Myxococcota bacterium]